MAGLRGRTVFITGASRGIGRGIAFVLRGRRGQRCHHRQEVVLREDSVFDFERYALNPCGGVFAELFLD